MGMDFYGMEVETSDGTAFKLYRGRRLVAVVHRDESGACRKVWGEMNDLTLALFQKHINKTG